jgi:hypothetical protein
LTSAQRVFSIHHSSGMVTKRLLKTLAQWDSWLETVFNPQQHNDVMPLLMLHAAHFQS